MHPSKFTPPLLIFCLILLASLIPPPIAQAQDEKQWLYDQMNALRGSLGLHGYSWNAALNTAAQSHSDWMAATGSISHQDDNGRGPADRAYTFGYQGDWPSENIYGGLRATASTAWNWWLNSPIHYSGITHARKTEVGIGVSSGPDGMRYYVLLFGEGAGAGIPLAAASPPAENPPPAAEVAAAPVSEQAAPPANPAPIPATARPLITFTPSPTIPTFTPTPSWTPTFTLTPSPTASPLPASSTPVLLATALPLEVALAQTPSPTFVTLPLSPVVDDGQAQGPALLESGGGGNPWRVLLIPLIGLQTLALAWVLRHLLARLFSS
jgi:uncharacterized protein YkwD